MPSVRIKLVIPKRVREGLTKDPAEQVQILLEILWATRGNQYAPNGTSYKADEMSSLRCLDSPSLFPFADVITLGWLACAYKDYI